MVELAVSIVVLMILLAGVVDLGRVAFYHLTIRDAAQEAASYASIFPHNNEQIFARALDGVNGDGVDPSRIKVDLKVKNLDRDIVYECNSSNSCANDTDTSDTKVVSENYYIEVTITDSAFPITMPLLGTFIGSQTINLNSTIEDIVVRVP
jgi:Flp pilus assembly protein TadG